MSASVQRVFVWFGPVFMLLFGLGFLIIAGYLPPPSPDDSAEEIAEFYTDDTNAIRIGLVMSLLAAPLQCCFITVVSLQMKRIEGPSAPLAYAQFATGIIGVVIFVIPLSLMFAAAYRPQDRDPEITQALNDAACLPFLGVVGAIAIQLTTIGVAILRDTAEQPLFPRWVGYFNLWEALLFIPGTVVFFVKTGPFAWDGVFAWWIPLFVFGGWFCVMTAFLLRAIATEEVTGQASRPGSMSDSRS